MLKPNAGSKEMNNNPGADLADTKLDSAKSRMALYAVCCGFFLVLLDTTALNVAVADMGKWLGGSMSGLQWVINSYTIVLATFLLICGALGDRIGAKILYQTGLVLFTLMSLGSALAPNIYFLIATRIFQGLGAAMMLPCSLALLSHAFPDPKERGNAVGFWASTASLGFAVGPVLGGLLVHYFGWRGIFWINVPTGIFAFFLNHVYVEETRVAKPRHIDWGGQMLLLVTLLALTFGLIQAGKIGWESPMILCAFALAALAGGIFVMMERMSATPAFPGSLFSIPAFAVCIGVGAVLNFTVYGVLFVESLYLQNVLRLDALKTGLIILPFTIFPTITIRIITKYFPDSQIRTRLWVGHLLSAIGALILCSSVKLNGIGPTVIGLGFMGVAMGCIMPSMTAGVLSSSPVETAGLASGILNSSRQVGGALGVALFGALVEAGQIHGMYWALAIAGAILITTLIIVRKFIPSSPSA
jgi:DHA2 family methylenomycin A resistance protein-like MFS transporter